MTESNNHFVKKFFNDPSLYYHAGDILTRSETTLPENVAKKVIEDISREVQKSNSSGALLDACGGIGYYSALLVEKTPTLKNFVLDLAYPMLRIGKNKINNSKLLASHAIEMLCADVYNLPLCSRSFNFIILFSALHLIPNKEKLLEEFKRILLPGGKLWILTFDPVDIKTTLYHRHFPGYYEIDYKRYVIFEKIYESLLIAGYKNVKAQKYPYSMKYDKVSDILELVLMKPFSTFSFYSDDEFRKSFYEFEKTIKAKYGDGPVVNKSKMILVSASV